MTENGTLSDEELVRECLAGSEQAWNQFYCKYVGLVKNIVRRRLGCKYDVNDISQSVFASLISALRTYDDTYSLQRFVSTVADRICIHEFRLVTAVKRRTELDAYEYSDEIISETASIEDHELQDEALAKKQLVMILRTGMQFLGERCRELLKLRYYEELSYKEIAALLGGTENSLTVQVRRCLDELKGRCKKILNKPRVNYGTDGARVHSYTE